MKPACKCERKKFSFSSSGTVGINGGYLWAEAGVNAGETTRVDLVGVGVTGILFTSIEVSVCDVVLSLTRSADDDVSKESSSELLFTWRLLRLFSSSRNDPSGPSKACEEEVL